MENTPDIRRRLPAVDVILRDSRLASSHELYGRELVLVQVRRELETLRARAAGTAEMREEDLDRLLEELPGRVARGLRESFGLPLQRVLNATGIFLHTNLGRAPLPRSLAVRISGFLDAYCNLEYRLAEGKRSDRNERASNLLQVATGAGGGIVVNNNAGALVLILSTLAKGEEVIVSRGELVEIGGSFRIPEIVEASGTRLVEVGTTNRTRIADYEGAITDRTGLLLKVYPSNYLQTGFTASVDPSALVELGGRFDLPVVVDEGSGLLRPHPAPQLADHPSMRELISVGCDLVCGSGDKLLGGPQAGLVVGKREAVERCRRNPLYRALRPDRFAFAALEGVLRMHLAEQRMPIDRLWVDGSEHRRRLEELAPQLGAEIVPAEAYLGGGTAPERAIVGEALALPGEDRLLEELRRGDPPVIGYLHRGRLILDLRTIDPADDSLLAGVVGRALARVSLRMSGETS
jgi:L-seryl-tRNA(Ser) seleniumtransferase